MHLSSMVMSAGNLIQARNKNKHACSVYPTRFPQRSVVKLTSRLCDTKPSVRVIAVTMRLAERVEIYAARRVCRRISSGRPIVTTTSTPQPIELQPPPSPTPSRRCPSTSLPVTQTEKEPRSVWAGHGPALKGHVAQASSDPGPGWCHGMPSHVTDVHGERAQIDGERGPGRCHAVVTRKVARAAPVLGGKTRPAVQRRTTVARP